MNVVIYARYSSRGQNEQSIEGQLEKCYDFAERHNFNVIGEYIDRALTGKTDNRPQFQQMVEDSSKKQFQGVIIYATDRFARNREDSAIYKKQLRLNNVRVFSATEYVSDAPYAVLLESVLEGQAEYYSLELSAKVKRGMKINASKCYYNGGSVPLGLKLETVEVVNGPMNKKIAKKKFVIDEEKAPIVQEIFEKYANGSTMADIIRYLNEKQIKTSQGNEFNKNSIRKILLNRKYIGYYSYEGKETKDGIPRIIDDETFFKVAEKLKENKQAPSKGKAIVPFILTTKLFCGNCNSMMTGYSGTSKTGKLHSYYGCKGTWANKCTRKGISKEYIENVVVTQALKLLTNENIDIIANTIVKLAEEEKEKTRIKMLEKALRKNEKAKANLFAFIKDCEIDNIRKSTYEEMEKIEKEHKQIEEQIRIEENNIVKVTVQQIKFFLKELRKIDISDIRYRQMLINMLVYKVFLYDDNLTIVFTTQNKFYSERIPKLSELESSFLGNQLPPKLFNKLNENGTS